MRTYLECFACFMNLSLSLARRAGCDENCQRDVLLKVAGTLPEFPMDSRPPEMSLIIQNLVRDITGIADPFREDKKESNRFALEAAPKVRRLIRSAEDPLLTAIEFSIAGNSIDYGASHDLDLLKTMDTLIEDESSRIRSENPEHFQLDELKTKLKKSGTLLYITDNAGEIVFDMLLIELLQELYPDLAITVAVRNSPVLNDATLEDAEEIGLTRMVPVISSGSDAAGTVISFCSRDFLDRFYAADMVIAKGQGNYETLSDVDREVFLMFKSKCNVIARHSGSNVGDIILLRGGGQAKSDGQAKSGGQPGN